MWSKAEGKDALKLNDGPYSLCGFFFFFLDESCGTRGFSSLTGYQTQAVGNESTES